VLPRARAAWRGWSDRLEKLFESERERLPLWIPIGIGLGISAWFVLPGQAAWTGFTLLSLALCVAFLAAVGTRRWGRALAIFALTAAIGCALIWLPSERVAAPRLERPVFTEFAAEIEAVESLPARKSVRLMLRPDPTSNLPPKVRVSLDQEKASDWLKPGAIIRLKARLMPPAPMAVPGAYDFARIAWFQGLGGTGKALGDIALVKPADDTGWRSRIAQWRQRLSDHVRSRIGGSEGAIAATLATGDRGAISEEDAEAMRRSGLAHLLSISGLHVAAVVGAAMLLTLKLLALSPSLALRWPLVLISAGAGALAGLGYTLLTGSEVPTIRACVAAMMVLAGIALGRDAMTLRLVAVGALVVLLFWPESLAGPSFQLSFAAVTAIVVLHEHPRIKALLARREEGVGYRFARILLSLFLTGLVVEAALAPIALYHFHKAGLYGALANIIAIPLTTFVIMPAEAFALLLDVAGLGAPFWWVSGQALGLLLTVAHATAKAPGAVTMLPTMPGAAFGLLIGGGLWLGLWRTRWRLWGLVPVAAGAFWALSTPAPDLIVTGDGRHLALRTSSGELAILRGRAGDYVRSMLSETSGSEGELIELDDVGGARCNSDMCAADIARDGRVWRLLATRSQHLVEIGELNRACGKADIVVSERRLPRTCRPRWLKADRALLSKTGGLSITLGENPQIAAVSDRIGRHPWAPRPKASSKTVRAEPVEALPFPSSVREEQGQAFDKLRANGDLNRSHR
jgi:competence protein ComEC